MGKLTDRIQSGWNAFMKLDYSYASQDMGPAYGYRPERARLTLSNERSIVSSIYNRIAIDVASVGMQHIRLDKNGQFQEPIDSGLQNCLTTEANIDQGSRAFFQDLVLTMFEKGTVAIVPVNTTLDPEMSGGYDIKDLRVGEPLVWYPRHVQCRVYNDKPDVGMKEDINLPKSMTALVENPLYLVMNETNSTLQRLIRKLHLLDAVDEASSSGKLDIIIQLPYVVKTESRRKQAEQRRTDLEEQLKGSTYGIGYTDGTEKITQLNRAVDNSLMSQIEYLVEMLYGELGITKEVMNGTADEATMINYYNRTVEPILAAIAQAMKRTFLTKTARSQGQSIAYFRDPFKLVPIAQVAEIADKFTRNEIATSNEFRGFIGIRPSSDPKADELRNANIPAPVPPVPPEPAVTETT